MKGTPGLGRFSGSDFNDEASSKNTQVHKYCGRWSRSRAGNMVGFYTSGGGGGRSASSSESEDEVARSSRESDSVDATRVAP